MPHNFEALVSHQLYSLLLSTSYGTSVEDFYVPAAKTYPINDDFDCWRGKLVRCWGAQSLHGHWLGSVDHEYLRTHTTRRLIYLNNIQCWAWWTSLLIGWVKGDAEDSIMKTFPPLTTLKEERHSMASAKRCQIGRSGATRACNFNFRGLACPCMLAPA